MIMLLLEKKSPVKKIQKKPPARDRRKEDAQSQKSKRQNWQVHKMVSHSVGQGAVFGSFESNMVYVFHREQEALS